MKQPASLILSILIVSATSAELDAASHGLEHTVPSSFTASRTAGSSHPSNATTPALVTGTQHWPSSNSTASSSNEHAWPSTSFSTSTARPFVSNSTTTLQPESPSSISTAFPIPTAHPIVTTGPTADAPPKCGGYLASCIAALLSIMMFNLHFI